MDRLKRLNKRLMNTAIPLMMCVLLLFVGSSYGSKGPDPAHVTPAKDRPITNLRDLNNAFIDIARSVTPSVVTVSTTRFFKVRSTNSYGFPFGSDPFAELFGFRNPRQNQQEPEQQLKQTGLGSGVIVSNEGYILTNNHVIQSADSIFVRTSDGRTLGAKVIGADSKTDIAVIKVEGTNLVPLTTGNSDSLQVGEIVMAIGSPLDTLLAHSVTQGIVSAKGRSNVGLADYEDFIQTDAAINPGNSGGALVNLDGELVGLNAAIASQSGGFQGIGFAVPINMAVRVMNMLISEGKVTRGWMGVTIQDVTDKLGAVLNLKSNDGALVGSVLENSPAAKAGLLEGDVITDINGKHIEHSNQLRSQIASSSPGTNLKLDILRDGEPKEVTVILGEAPSDNTTTGGNTDLLSLLGFSVSKIDNELGEKYNLNAKQQGLVIVNVEAKSNAYSVGLRVGDVIRSINRRKVSTIAEFEAAVKNLKKGNSVVLLIERQGNGFFVPLEL